jgi:hypothetical protein
MTKDILTAYESAQKAYRAFGYPAFSEQVLADLVEWSEASEAQILTMFRTAHLNPAMR